MIPRTILLNEYLFIEYFIWLLYLKRIAIIADRSGRGGPQETQRILLDIPCMFIKFYQQYSDHVINPDIEILGSSALAYTRPILVSGSFPFQLR